MFKIKQYKWIKLRSILLLLVIFVIGCKAFDKKTQFDMSFTQSITIESSSGLQLPFNVSSPDVETNSESTFSVNDTRKDLIEEILLTNMSLKLKSPSNGDFSFLESIAIYIAADGLSEIKIAWKESIANNESNVIELDVTGSDLKEYIKKDEFDLRVNAVTDEYLTSDHQIDVMLDLHVDAKILGQ